MLKHLIISFALIGMVATGAKYTAKGTAKASTATAKAAKKTGRGLLWFAKNI